MGRKLRDSVAVVTGASSGIGRATARALAGKGSTIVLTARRADVLADAVAECEAAGGQARAVPADVSDPQAVATVAAEAAEGFGRIDAWVNNAAVNLYGGLLDVPVRDWHRVIEVNLLGYYHGARAVLPWFHEQGSGVLVNVSSVLGKVPSPYQSAYVATKAAIRALSDSLRQEVAEVDGIDVVTVLAGAVDTPLFEHAGNYSGRRPRPPRPVIAPQRVAEAIATAVRRPRREVVVGASTRAGLAGRRLLPGATERAAARAVEADQFTDEPERPSPGNLFAPVPAGREAGGGWQERDGSPLRRAAVVGAAGTAAALLLRNRTRS